MKPSFLYVMILFILFFAPLKADDNPLTLTPEEKTFSVNEYLGHLRFLSHDLLEGRTTGSRGIQLAAAYIAAQFEAMGLNPIDEKNGYRQEILFEGFNTDEQTLMTEFTGSGNPVILQSSEEICLVSELAKKDKIEVEGDLVFIGYGIDAPEYKWNDFKNVDITDKIIVALVNDPDYKKTRFGNESLTYYGRWMYKIEMARRKKAKAILMIHHDVEATYGWNVVQTGWVGERVNILNENPHPLTFTGWISHQAFNKVLAGTGLDYLKLKARADKRNFKPMPLKTRLKVSFKQNYRTFSCANIIGIIPGTDPELKKEAVIYMAHHDHLGVGLPDSKNDIIYNGALDNASGTAALICLARTFVHCPSKPKRTLIFMIVTAEELGLLGSTWYAEHPVVPLADTAIIINKDCMDHFGQRSGFDAFPAEFSSALPEIEKIGQSLGLTLHRRKEDTGGGAFRSDHFPFATRGVTALSVRLAGDYQSTSKEEVKSTQDKIGSTYHRPNDEIHPLWRYDGVIQELILLYRLGRHWADGAAKPFLQMTQDNPYTAVNKWYGIK